MLGENGAKCDWLLQKTIRKGKKNRLCHYKTKDKIVDKLKHINN